FHWQPPNILIARLGHSARRAVQIRATVLPPVDFRVAVAKGDGGSAAVHDRRPVNHKISRGLLWPDGVEAAVVDAELVFINKHKRIGRTGAQHEAGLAKGEPSRARSFVITPA